MDAHTTELRDSLAGILAPREEVVASLHAIGCTLVLTDLHLLLVREGRAYRPRSGVQIWPLDPTLTIRTTPTGSQPGRVLITSGGHVTSVFVAADQHHAADLLVADAKRRIHAHG